MEALVHGTTSPLSRGSDETSRLAGCITRVRASRIATGRLTILAMTAITIASFALRIRALDSESLWLDEIRTVNTFRLPFSEIPRGAAMGLAQPPLDSLIGAVVHRLGLSGSDWWTRLPAAIFGTLSAAVLGILLLRACSFPIAIGAVILLAVCPLHVAMSQELRPYAICLFLALLTVWAFSLARQRNTLRWWILFAIVLEAFLLTRWTDPSFVICGLVAFSLLRMVQLPRLSTTQRSLERSRLIRSAIATALAYACYLPIFLMILKRSHDAVHAKSAGFMGRWVGQLTESFAALFSGSSQQVPTAATPIDVVWLILALTLCLVGLIVLIRHARRNANERLTVILFAFVPFPIIYSLVYSLMTPVVPKVQYLLILAIPVFMGLSAGLYATATQIARRPNLIRAAVYTVALTVTAGGMTRFTLAHQNQIEKRDWRGVMRYLASHASGKDCFAVIGADTFPSTFYNGVFARGRYGLWDADFLRINVNTQPDALEKDAWQRADGILWLLAYRDRMYTGINETIVSRPWSQDVDAVDFNGFQLIRCGGSQPARDRLIDALGHLLDQLPAEKSFIAPSVFLARCFAQCGRIVQAEQAERTALQQCANDVERQALRKQVLSQIGVAEASGHRGQRQP